MKLNNIINILTPAFVDRPFKLEKPTVIQFPVIDICNSRCQMCKIWENKQSTDITVDELRKGLSSGLFSEVTGIGFNGGEPTLRKDLTDLVQVAVDCLPKLYTVSLITNAFKYKEVIRQIESVGQVLKKAGKHFDLMVSLDGYGVVHDRVRGKEGNFDRAQYVIDFAKGSPLVGNLRIGCTVIRENVYELADLLDYCIENDLYVKFRQGVPHQRLYTENLIEPYALTFEERYEFVEFLEGLIKNYETGYLQNHFYKSLIGQVVDSKPRRAGCDWQHRGATITAKGELAYCAVKSKSFMENISQGDPEDYYFGNENHLKDIINNECDDCHHDYVGRPPRADYIRYLLSHLDKRLRFKERIRAVPGFSVAQNFRLKRQYYQLYGQYKDIGTGIPFATGEEGQEPQKLMICGWYGTETLGDKAIIGGIIKSVRTVFGNDCRITVASLFPYISEMTRRQMPEFDGVQVVTLGDALRQVANCDHLLFGGGPMMAINELAPMQVLFERAREAGVNTIAAGVGVGPLGAPWLNQSIKDILSLCNHRIYRDEKSLHCASDLGLDTSGDVVAEDPALSWLHGSSSDLPIAATKGDSGEKILILGLRDFPYREYAKGIKESEAIKIKSNYEESIVKALEKLVEQDKDWVIKPLPMCTNHFGDDDRWFYRRLFRGNSKLKPFLDYSLLGRELAPTDYVEAYKSADVLLGMRFHSLVFGLGLNTPSVAIDYTLGKGKVKSLADRFDITCLSMFGLDSSKIVSAISHCYSTDQSKTTDILDNLSFPPALKNALNTGVVS